MTSRQERRRELMEQAMADVAAVESLLGQVDVRVGQASRFRVVGFLLGPAVDMLGRVIRLVGGIRLVLVEVSDLWREDGWW